MTYLIVGLLIGIVIGFTAGQWCEHRLWLAELNPEYAAMSRRRIEQDRPLFNRAEADDCVTQSNEKEETLPEKPEQGFLEPSPAAGSETAAGVATEPS